MISKKVEIVVTYRITAPTKKEFNKGLSSVKKELCYSSWCFGKSQFSYKRIGKGKIK